jgi:hypothetical protein
MGGMAGTKGEAYLDRVKNKIKQKQVVRDGSVETEYNPASTQEDYFIGVSGEGKGSRVETLPGGENLGRIEDLQYFNRKLALGLRIPPSYMDSSGESDKDTYSDGRVGTAYIAELRYVGFVKRLQKGLAKPLFKHFKEFSKKEGVEIPEELEFYIEPPQSFAEYKESELNSVLLNLYASAEGIESMSKRFALEKFMRMNTAEISLNEELKLKEMGYDKKSISSMAEEIKMNLVYGDGSAASKLEDEPIEQDGYDELDVGGDEAGKAVTINIQK